MTLRLIEDFFEVGANPENVAGGNWSINGGRVGGSGAMTSSGSGTWAALTGQGWASGIADFYCGFALRAGTNMNGVNIVTAYSDLNTTPHLTLSMDSSNRLTIWRGLASSGGTLLATSATPFSVLGQWRSINLYFKIDDATGRAVVKVDGNTQIDYSGDTRNGGSAGTIDGFRASLNSSASNGIADLVICDGLGTVNNTYPGDIACIRRLPNGNGTYSQFTGSDGNSVDNYALVDEAPSNDTDYTYATASGQKDSYAVEDLPPATLSVMGVRAVAKTAKSGAGAAGMSVMIRENGTDTYSSSVPLSTSFSWQGDVVREVKPSNSSAWTISDVNAMEIGVRSESS
jgi:hypothetical protein